MVRWLRKLHLKWGLKRAKNCKKCLLKKHFLTTWPLGGSKKLNHMKFKSKISYLGPLEGKKKLFHIKYKNKISYFRRKNLHSTLANGWAIGSWSWCKKRDRKGEKLQKVPLLKSIFWPLGPLGGQKNCTTLNLRTK